MTASALRTHGLGLDYGPFTAVRAVDLDVRPRTLHALIGPNGAGKTSFFNIVSGRYAASRGKVELEGRDITARPARSRVGLGMARSFGAEAVTDCTLRCYQQVKLGMDKAGTTAVPQQLFSYAMGRLAKAQEHAMVLSRRSALERVASFLVEWAKQSSRKGIVSLAMTRTDIGDYLGLTIETVSRSLSHLERQGHIALPTARPALMGPDAAVNGVYYNQIHAIEDPAERAAYIKEKQDEYASGIDVFKIANANAVEAVVPANELRAELTKRLALYSTRPTVPVERRQAVTPA